MQVALQKQQAFMATPSQRASMKRGSLQVNATGTSMRARGAIRSIGGAARWQLDSAPLRSSRTPIGGSAAHNGRSMATHSLTAFGSASGAPGIDLQQQEIAHPSAALAPLCNRSLLA
jgi:hypothetical protein